MKRILLLGAIGLIGCNRNPNIEIVGSYFPGWLICLVLGVVLTAIAHTWLRRRYALYSVGHPALIYPALLVFFTCLLWLLIFA